MDLCLSENARRLVGKLVDMGVEFTGLTIGGSYGDTMDSPYATIPSAIRKDTLRTLFIQRDRGQGMMNKATGEIAPTWHLAANAAHRLGRFHSWSGGEYPLLQYDGIEYTGVSSHMPLTWILRQPLQDWSFSRAEASEALDVAVRENPPHW